jgi:hypothetical protein
VNLQVFGGGGGVVSVLCVFGTGQRSVEFCFSSNEEGRGVMIMMMMMMMQEMGCGN